MAAATADCSGNPGDTIHVAPHIRSSRKTSVPQIHSALLAESLGAFQQIVGDVQKTPNGHIHPELTLFALHVL